MEEMGDHFDLERVLRLGSLPKVTVEAIQLDWGVASDYLESYVTTYIKEEIQAEAIVRNVGAFQRFLSIAAQSNAQTIEFSNISRESSTPSSTVKEYYQIIEDTLIGFFLWPHNRKERKKARPKFYFFDTGVVRALQKRLSVEVTPTEREYLFETWIINELIRINEYLKKRLDFSFWRERGHKVDILISRSGEVIAGVEVKSGKKTSMSPTTKKRFQDKFPSVPIYTVTDSSPSLSSSDSLDIGRDKLSYVEF